MSRSHPPRATALFALTLFALAAGLLLGLARGAGAATARSGFVDQKIATVGAPTALAFTPDGQMLVAMQQGKVNAYKVGALIKVGALNLPPS